MEFLVLGVFCLSLFLCIIFDFSILYALVFGFVLFSAYGIKKGHSPKAVMGFALKGVKTVKNILITFILIGILTALWRDAGTIPTIVCHASKLIHPSVFVVMTFILNCLISVLTGTAFGTAATMGVICSAIGSSLGVSQVITGGAVLSGVYFGDRCSPVSTSALLVSELTKTSIFDNIKNMIRSCFIPLLLSCGVYTAIGLAQNAGGKIPNLSEIFSSEFNLSLITLLPAVILLVLSAARVNVKIAMSVSILTALPICIFVQGTPFSELLKLMVTGYKAESAEVAKMLSGGGIISMLRVGAIVCLSSAYSGIFGETGLLTNAQTAVKKLSAVTCPYVAALFTAIITSMIACNQTLSIMLTNQLCSDTENDKSRFALYLEDTAVIVAPLVPWSIAGAVVFASVEAPTSALFTACFLYILPLYRAICETVKIKSKKKTVNV